jgi:hypothetical protein
MRGPDKDSDRVEKLRKDRAKGKQPIRGHFEAFAGRSGGNGAA